MVEGIREQMPNEVVETLDFEEALKYKAIERFRQTHSKIYASIRSMLATAKIKPMDDLLDHNPSFTEMAKNLRNYQEICNQLNTILENTIDLTMLEEYISLIEDLAEAIDSQHYDTLGAAIAALDEKPYI